MEGASQPDRARQSARSGVWLTDALLVTMALLWGVNFSVVKFGTTAISPLAFNGARMLLASVVLVAIVSSLPGAWPSRRDTIALLVLGLLGNGLYQWFFVEGIARMRAGSAALVLAAVPAIVAILGRLRGTERMGVGGVAGIVLSMGGIGLIVYGGQHASDDSTTLVGAALVFAGAFCWALYNVLLKPYTHRVDGMRIHALTMWSGTLLLGVVALPAMLETSWLSMSFAGWGAVLYSGLGALVLAYIFWYRGIRQIGPTRTAMYSNVQPAIALLVAWMLIDEVPTLWQIAGALLILIGVVLVRRSPDAAVSAPAPHGAPYGEVVR